MEKKKIDAVPILTSIFCAYVVMIHLMSDPVTRLQAGSLAHELFFCVHKYLHFAVPGFVFLSGLKLTYSYRQKPLILGEYMKKRVLKLLIPYLFWYILYYLFFRYKGYMEAKTIWDHVFSFLIGDLVSPFYFITLIFQFYIIFPALLALRDKINHNILMLLVVIVQVVYFFLPMVPYEDRFFLSYLFYFMLGYMMALHLDSFEKCLKKFGWLWILIHALFTGYFLWEAYSSAMGLTVFSYWRIKNFMQYTFAILAYISIGLWISVKAKQIFIRIFQVVDQASYYIYLNHCFMIYLGKELWARVHRASVVEGFLFVSAFTIFTVVCLNFGYLFIKKKLSKK